VELRSIEVCAGAGGQALGLERAGFEHVALVEIDSWACRTLRHNRPDWNVIEGDIKDFDGSPFEGQMDLLAGGVPCPPFSVAGKQLGREDERDLFPQMLRLAREMKPRAVLIENVRGLLDPAFKGYRLQIEREFHSAGFRVQGWKLLNASDFGVPQLRPRVAMVALRDDVDGEFEWPECNGDSPSVGSALLEEVASRGWDGAKVWADRADSIAPTVVGGSRKHGGPDLGPTRAREAWAKLGVEGRTIAEEPPAADHEGPIRLTVRMASIVQGFDPDEWTIVGRKTQAYRQVGNAFPPPVAEALGHVIRAALDGERVVSLKDTDTPRQEQLSVAVG